MIFRIFTLIVLICLDGFVSQEEKDDDGPKKNLLNLTTLNNDDEVSKFILADTKECSEDILSLCPNSKNKNLHENNFGVLICVQNSPNFMELSAKCNNLLWSYKLNLTQTKFFLSVSKQMCGKAIFQLPQCSEYYEKARADIGDAEISSDIGIYLSCLVEHREQLMDQGTAQRHQATSEVSEVAKLRSKSCTTFLTHLAEIIFSDYRLIHSFRTACHSDILSKKCGRLEPLVTPGGQRRHDGQTVQLHSQGATVQCLNRRMSEGLEPECRKAIFRIAELQSDDFHLDRPLYFACLEDREKFCPNVISGRGKVYSCLLRHKGEDLMSETCRTQLTDRERLMGEDYRVSYGLKRSCEPYVEKFCAPKKLLAARERNLARNGAGGGTLGGAVPDHVTLSLVLVCLEGLNVDSECHSEILEHRLMLAKDYALSPGIVVYCEREIGSYCRGTEKDGTTLKCLMDIATPQFADSVGGANPTDSKAVVSPKCWAELWELQEAVKPGQDYRADPFLIKDCSTAIDKFCSGATPSEVLDCLLTTLSQGEDEPDPRYYGDRCKGRVLQLQFFMSRRLALDYPLYQACKTDASTFCGFDEKDLTRKDVGEAEDRARQDGILACLFREAYAVPTRIGANCAGHVIRIMEARAISVGLLPQIQVPCIHDLALRCSDGLSHGQELHCLQNNYETLSRDCQAAMFNFTRAEGMDYRLDPLLVKACSRPIRAWCLPEVSEEGRDHLGQVLSCLIGYKDHPDTPEQCRAHVTHHQIISLKDVQFSPAFWEACRSNARQYCGSSRRSYKKGEILVCLSTVLLNDTLRFGTYSSEDRADGRGVAKRHRLTPKCRKSMKTELLERNEDVELDPKLEESCRKDLEKFCSSVGHSSAQRLECLKDSFPSLSHPCQKEVFGREEETFALSSTDYALVKACAKMIQHFCGKDDTVGDILTCLLTHKDEETMEGGCKTLLTKRQIEQSKDYRLNTALVTNCRFDIGKHCRNSLKPNRAPSVLEGEVIYCLRKKFVKKVLSPRCHGTIAGVLKQTALDYRLDADLARACHTEIRDYCAPFQESEFHPIPDEEGDKSQKMAAAAEQELPEGAPIDNGRVGECLRRHLVRGRIRSEECRAEVIRILSESRADIHADPVLDQACQFDIPRHCPTIIPGEGRQMSCILEVMRTSSSSLTPDCRKLLKERTEMWEYAIKFAPPESMMELADTLMTYHAKNYLLLSLAFVVAFLFALGCVMGRVTKRVLVDAKNR